MSESDWALRAPGAGVVLERAHDQATLQLGVVPVHRGALVDVQPPRQPREGVAHRRV